MRVDRQILRAGLASWLWLAQPATGAPPIEAFGALPAIDLIALSPDGTKVASAVTVGSVRQVQVRNVADASMVATYPADKAKIRAVTWAGDHHLLVVSSQTRDSNASAGSRYESAIVSDVNFLSGKTAILLDRPVNGVARIGSSLAGPPMVRMIDGRPTAFVTALASQSGRIGRALFRIDLDTQAARVVIGGDAQTQQWLVDEAGAVVARVEYSGYNDAFDYHGRWELWTKRGSGFVNSFEDAQPIDTPQLVGLGRTAGTVMVHVHDDDRWTYREVAVGEQATLSPIAELTAADPVSDPKTHLVIGAQRQNGMRNDYSFFAEADRQLWRGVVKAFPASVVHIVSWSDDRHRLILQVEGRKTGSAFYLLDATTHKAEWLADRYDGIAAADLGETRAISYPASDGLAIMAFLTLPPGGSTGLPLVVLPHGGPAARDDAGFDWWAQALASRGYAVLQPQFRGSVGFGEPFHAAGYGEWGRKMQTDLSDGVAYLAAAKIIDPNRVGIVGASYGGYAALSGVTLQTGIYRCAVSLAGISDLRAMLAYDQHRTRGWENPALRYVERYLGAKSRTDAALDALSPITFANKVTVPVLLIHGTDDTVVPFAQSKAMAAALATAGHSATLVTLPGEDHWLSRGETRAAMLRATADFLATNLPAGNGKSVAMGVQ